MTDQEILEGLQHIVRERLQLSTTLTKETALTADLDLDSLKRLTLMVEMENHFAIRFDDDDGFGLDTAADLIDLIKAKRQP